MSEAPEISRFRVYGVGELEKLLGPAVVAGLRRQGLRAVSGRYLGKNVIDAFDRAQERRRAATTPTQTKGAQSNAKAERMGEDRHNSRMDPPKGQERL